MGTFRVSKNLTKLKITNCLHVISASFFSTKYTNQHLWMKIDSLVKKEAYIGINKYAEKKLGTIINVQLPSVGQKVNKKEVFASIESVDGFKDCYCPFSFEIVEINKTLMKNPFILNESCTETGWLVKVKIDNLYEFEKLMDTSQYMEFLKKIDNNK